MKSIPEKVSQRNPLPYTNGSTPHDLDAEFGSYSVPIPEEAAQEESQPNRVTQWELRTLKHAYQPRKPINYIVDGIFAEATLNIVYGAPGSLKSMILADMMVCVAAGLPWLEPIPQFEPAPKPVYTMQCPALWVDFDNGTRRTDERFDALARARELPEDTPLHYVSMPSPWLNASDKGFMNEFADLIQSYGIKLVIVDNLGLITGGTEENSADMASVMGNLRSLAEITGAAVVIIHHQRKGSAGSTGRKGDTLRGHSSIEAALDLAVVVEREMGSNDVNLIATKVRGADFSRLSAMFTYQHREGTKELETARFYGQVTEQVTAEKAIDEAIIDIIAEHSRINKTQLTDKAKEYASATYHKVRNRLTELVRQHRIVEECEGAGKPTWYSLPK